MQSIAQNRPQSPTSVIYSSPTSSSLIVDIPTSISLAQHLHPLPQRYPLIFSSPAPTVPYPSTEPKTEHAKINVLARIGAEEHAVTDDDWLREAWEQLRREKKDGVWCLSRNVRRERERSIGNRKKNGVEKQQPKCKWTRKGTDNEAVSENFNEPHRLERRQPLILRSVQEITNASEDRTPLRLDEVSGRLVQNPTCEVAKLFSLSLNPLPTSATYLIPPGSSFFQGTVNQDSAAAFSKAAMELHPGKSLTGAGPGEFEIVVLDPPWQNRSVRHSSKYSMMSKDTHDNSGLLSALSEILGRHIAMYGTIACWITNKRSVRGLALQLFNSWGVELVEELVWLKVTTEGVPVLEIPSLWRKPYETCLIGRKVGISNSSTGVGIVKRRLMVAVPDVHSRKPCLKEFLRCHDTDCRGLEIFARSLTANWCAWGDEVLSSAEQRDWAFPNEHVIE